MPSFKIGFILLWGLFIYDIFWVFGTEVMTTVASQLQAPIKIQFPIDLNAKPPKFSMIGLGDLGTYIFSDNYFKFSFLF